jgi:hypothetical protein
LRDRLPGARTRLVAEVVDHRRYFDHSLQTVECDLAE